ncbi:MAG: ABC transporter substrate-binding protein [Clostridia bacterium]|nr:ABC transporter substrate-binding protein [Clostridia bacterium]
MKKIFSLLLTLLMLLGIFCSCSDGSGSDTAVYRIGICQFLEHTAVDSATEGFKAALTEKLGDEVSFDVKNASGEKMNAQSICSGFAGDNVSLIFANSTNALAAAAEATSVIPVVACCVTDFGGTLGTALNDGKTGINVTGCSDLLPLEKQAEVINEIFPAKGTVGILYCSSETNSKYQADEISKHLSDLGFEVKVFTFVDTTDVTLVTQQAAAECDVIYTPTDNTVASNTQAINNILEPARVPLVAGNIDVAVECGIATVGIDYYKLGYEAGLMAYEILKENRDPADMEIHFAEEYFKKYVPERAALLGIKIPEGYTVIKGNGRTNYHT